MTDAGNYEAAVVPFQQRAGAPIRSVRGGAGGVAARFADLATLGRCLDDAGERLVGGALEHRRLLLDPDLAASAALSPATAARAEEAVLSAITGGVIGIALALQADALRTRASMAAYQAVDDLQRELWEALDYGGGRLAGVVLPIGVGLLAGAGLVAEGIPLTRQLLATPGGRALLLRMLPDVTGWLEAHPGVVEHATNGGGGFLDGLVSVGGPAGALLLASLGVRPLHPSTESAAAELARLFRDGQPVVTPLGRDTSAGGRHTARSVDDLLAVLAGVSDFGSGTIAIQRIPALTEGGLTEGGLTKGGEYRYVVYLPGTDAWPLPGRQDDRVRDTGANLRLVGGRDTAYARGVGSALSAAGVPAGADVLLVGHSQGGMTALELAGDRDFSSRYRVSHVITAGSPAGQVRDVPARTQVLSLENEHDLVPRLDGEANRDQPNRTTVVFDARTGDPPSLGGNHSLTAYRRGARAVDASDDPSLARYVESLKAAGYVGATGKDDVDTQRYRISRGPRPPR